MQGTQKVLNKHLSGNCREGGCGMSSPLPWPTLPAITVFPAARRPSGAGLSTRKGEAGDGRHQCPG